MLSANNITKAFKKRVILNSVGFSLPKNTVVGLCGRNGVGKTTLIKILLGIYAADVGDVTNESRHTKIIFDVPPKLENMKVKDYLNFFSLLYQDAYLQDSEVLSLLDRINLKSYANKKVSQLSYGMKKILYISTLLLGKTDLAFIDEPFNGLDPVSLAIVKNIFEQIRDENGALIVVSSHLLNELASICEHFLIVKDADVRYIESISQESRKIRLMCSKDADVFSSLRNFGDISRVSSSSYNITIKNGCTSSDIVRKLYEDGIVFDEIYYLNAIDV